MDAYAYKSYRDKSWLLNSGSFNNSRLDLIELYKNMREIFSQWINIFIIYVVTCYQMNFEGCNDHHVCWKKCEFSKKEIIRIGIVAFNISTTAFSLQFMKGWGNIIDVICQDFLKSKFIFWNKSKDISSNDRMRASYCEIDSSKSDVDNNINWLLLSKYF